MVVDAKTSLDAFLDASKHEDAQARAVHLKRHARALREHMKLLASKTYWKQFNNSPDFVVMFVPGEQFLAAALEHDSSLLEDSLKNKVIPASPSSLIALLRAVAFGWRQMEVARNAEKIRDLGEELYNRIANFTEHLTRVGKHLGDAVEYYNKAVGSCERQLIPGARRFAELGIEPKKEVTDLPRIDKRPQIPAQ
jgi:DNA recombination protein RmuC